MHPSIYVKITQFCNKTMLHLKQMIIKLENSICNRKRPIDHTTHLSNILEEKKHTLYVAYAKLSKCTSDQVVLEKMIIIATSLQTDGFTDGHRVQLSTKPIHMHFESFFLKFNKSVSLMNNTGVPAVYKFSD